MKQKKYGETHIWTCIYDLGPRMTEKSTSLVVTHSQTKDENGNSSLQKLINRCFVNMVNYAWEERSYRKIWRRSAAVLMCNSIFEQEHSVKNIVNVVSWYYSVRNFCATKIQTMLASLLVWMDEVVTYV